MKREDVLEYMSKAEYKPLDLRGFRDAFNLLSSDDYIDFVKLMNMLEEEGEIVRTNKDLYHLPKSLDIYKGTIVSVKKHFAFASLNDFDEEIYIDKENLKDAIFKDEVLIQVLKGRTEGKVYSVLKRGLNTVVGEYENGFLLPDDSNLKDKIYVDKPSRVGLVNGHKIVCLLKSNNMGLVGHVVQTLGHKNDPGVDILSILARNEVRVEFPVSVQEELKKVPSVILNSEGNNRKDLTDRLIVTIDGDDALDYDDAIEVVKTENGYKLYVCIADVSYYVKDKSELDKEAFLRGTSIYMVNKVVPMLPQQLSNGICSLVPNEDRLTLTCEMDFDKSGNLDKYDIYPSIIRSKARLTYKEVNKHFYGEKTKLSKEIKEMLNNALELASILQKKRKDSGEIELDIPEAKFIVDENNRIKDIVVRVQDKAENLIEAFMIAANETVANHIYWMKLPFIYRVHDKPVEKKIKNFYSIASIMGYKIKVNKEGVYAKQLQDLLNNCKDEREKNVLGTFLLRSMAKAKYQVENIGHFGLASKCYTHFTSPIRRYPDLEVHRLLRKYVFDNNYFDNEKESINLLAYKSEQCSLTERKAIEVEREVESVKKAEYMASKIGSVYEGVVSSANSKGVFVELYNTVEGMVPYVSMKDDYYVFNDKTLSAIGVRTRRQIRIGDKIRVKVFSVDKTRGEINFEMIRKEGKGHGSNKRK